MFRTVLSSLAVGTKFMCADSIEIYTVTKVSRGMLKTIVSAQNINCPSETFMCGTIRVMPLYSL